MLTFQQTSAASECILPLMHASLHAVYMDFIQMLLGALDTKWCDDRYLGWLTDVYATSRDV